MQPGLAQERGFGCGPLQLSRLKPSGLEVRFVLRVAMSQAQRETPLRGGELNSLVTKGEKCRRSVS
jgi:hypothetical protein